MATYNIKIMFKNLLLASLLLTIAVSDTYYITPTIPPNAYQNQYYTIRFRVRGLDNPVFSFVGLPKTISATNDGLLSGTPTEAGSYQITINYSSGSVSGSGQFILKVSQDYSLTNEVLTVSQTSLGLVIEYPSGLVLRAGQSWSISLSASNGKGPYVWQFNGLPSGLIGDSRSGRISGSVANSGYYNFNVECADSTGSSAVAYYTINVQPQANIQSNILINYSFSNC